ncbi:putative alpha-glucosidase [Violaceomyces palustris]|uniref:Alpha-glucosidase n=1 Tax=Violaceomyces palustris TaxID=1673888 RepID=A0ACD0P0T5_9BASI|nr:putative alpha-glucosidase [Violaceomyces palustris]
MPSNDSLARASGNVKWWKNANIFQIWPASYKDSNGDGIGDIQGIISTLDYIKALGVNTIWISPMYDSPQIDMGYDISDYESVYPPYGTLDDMDQLIKGCHDRGMKLLLDLVINHTSDQHKWFQESRSSKTNPKRDWYIWRPAKYDADGNRQPPNNWMSCFSECAWTWDEHTQEYYLHLFCVEQPDLNWTNEECRREIYRSAMEFWLEKGVDGFRVDTVNMYSKPMDFPDAPIVDPLSKYQPAGTLYCNGPEMHKYLREMAAILARYDAMTVGELPLTPNTKDVLDYVSLKDPQLSMVFQFDLVDIGRGPVDMMKLTGYKLSALKAIINKWQTFIEGNDGWTTVFSENHDQGRSVSRFASDAPEHATNSAKLLAMLNTTLTGTMFIYQGQEIGMTNVPKDWPIEEYLDVGSINYMKLIKEKLEATGASEEEKAKAVHEALLNINAVGRDNARTPVQWDSSPHAGFTTGKPWMRVNDNYKKINAAAQINDPDSVLSFWKRMIGLRTKHSSLFTFGSFHLLEPENEQTFSYVKKSAEGDEKALVVLNFTDQAQEFKLPTEDGANWSLLQGTQPVEDPTSAPLKAYEGRVFVNFGARD